MQIRRDSVMSVIRVDILLEPLLDDLAQRPKTACVPIPNILNAASLMFGAMIRAAGALAASASPTLPEVFGNNADGQFFETHL
jgi:hypothetical protein